MFKKGLVVAAAGFLVTPLLIGCASCGDDDGCGTVARTTYKAETVTHQDTSIPPLPRGADSGECYALVYLPPETRTVTERVLVKEASEDIEIVPARYEWVEERICVKPASKRLEVVPAEYATREQRVVVEPGYKSWVKTQDADCVMEGGKPVGSTTDVFCLVEQPPRVETITQQCVKQKAHVRELVEPAQYDTVRRQKLVEPACARKITIPAEYEAVTKTVTTGSGRMEWRHVVCEEDINANAINNIKGALQAKGYPTGPLNGQFDETTWASLKDFQNKHRLGAGVLSYETLDKLNVVIK
jgi:hypothetical protein